MDARFLELLAEALERDDPLTSGTRLRDVEEWDSLGMLSTLSMVDEEYEIVLTNAVISAADTPADIWDAVVAARE